MVGFALASPSYAEPTLPVQGPVPARAKLTLDAWVRRVIDPNRPYKAVFVLPADLTGDGKRDIVAGAWWYRNPGSLSGSWARKAIGSPLYNVAAVADFDRDGDPDILGTQGKGATANQTFAWARNNGSGAFTIFPNIATASIGNFLQGVAVARFTSGGPLEVALSWAKSGSPVQKLRVPANPSAGAWPLSTLSTSSLTEQLTVGDIDRDGDLDLLQGTQWLRKGTSSWTAVPLYSPIGHPDRSRLADVDRDGRLDAVAGNYGPSVASKLAWYRQPTTATNLWTETVISSTVVGPMSVDAADMDADGDIDVIVGEHNLVNPTSAHLFIFENLDGRGKSWSRHTVYTGDEHHDGAQVADMDGDGDLDIVSVGWSHGRTLVYENRAK
ncbi:MAG: VCBS repeat-containing protein [Dermatophilaceae bacterium]